MCFCPVSPCSRVTKDDVFLSEGGGVVSSGEVYPASRVRRVLWARVALVLT